MLLISSPANALRPNNTGSANCYLQSDCKDLVSSKNMRSGANDGDATPNE